MDALVAFFQNYGWWLLALAIVLFPILMSFHLIGPTEVGLVTRRFSFKGLNEESTVAFNGEAGYQGRLLMPGLRFHWWIISRVDKFPWVQVPAGEIGVVIAQAGASLPIGAKSALYKPEFGNFTDLKSFIENGGQKGVQRPVLPPGSMLPIHPVGFLVITKRKIYGVPISPDLRDQARNDGILTPESFGLDPRQLDLTRIAPQPSENGKTIDSVGIVTTFEGDPLPPGEIASRLGGYEDMRKLEAEKGTDAQLIETLMGSKNGLHNNYQDYQAFLDHGGRIGLQHDLLLYGAYALNPFLVRVEVVPMLMVQQGEVAVIKAYTGMVTEDTSGEDFKFGSLVRPGHRGIWQVPLRTGKYPINPRCYDAEIVPTAILTLNWSETTSAAHQLDAQLVPIVAKSREGFVFKLDLQVQIHVPDTHASRVISMFGTMQNLVNEVLQAVVGNHFRDTLQSMPAVEFIDTRKKVQSEAYTVIREQIDRYHVETRGVYIQDVAFPPQMVKVLTEREIAKQEVETFKRQREAQDQRIQTEHARGTADMQPQLARSKVNVEIHKHNAVGRKAQAEGESIFIRETGSARGAQVEAIGLARARGYQAQVAALGSQMTGIVNSVTALAESGVRFTPEIFVSGSGAGDGLAAQLMNFFKNLDAKHKTEAEAAKALAAAAEETPSDDADTQPPAEDAPASEPQAPPKQEPPAPEKKG